MRALSNAGALRRAGFAAALCGLAVTAAAWPGRAAVPTPGASQDHPIALLGATIHPVSGPEIPNGTVVFDKGRVHFLGAGAAVPADAERIDVSGKQIYPGLIDPYSIIGLSELEAVRATNDYAEVGQNTPNVKAQVAVNPESEPIPVTRSNGVLLALVAPRGAGLRGTSALMMLDGWTWEDMTLAAPVAMHMNWPGMVITAGQGRFGGEPEEKQKENRARALRVIRDTFDEARAYWKAKKAAGRGAGPDEDARWEAMIPVLEGRMPLVVEADEIQQIQAAVAFADEQKIKLILYGGYDSPRCAELLKRHDVPVIVRILDRLPGRRYEAYDAAFTVPERLRQAGVRFCIANGGGFWNERNLPYEAAKAVAFGLPRDEALKSITLYPARILGVADRVGSLEVGKDATLIVTDGDPLETPTHVEMAFLQGRKVDLQDKQKVLWKKYQERYRRLGITERHETARSSGGSGKGGVTPESSSGEGGRNSPAKGDTQK